MRRIVLLLWLSGGMAVLLHDAFTGGGIVGYLLYREIVGFGAIEPNITYIAVAIPLVAIPAFLSLPGSRTPKAGPPLSPGARRAAVLAGGIGACVLAYVTVLALASAAAVPGPTAPVVRIVLDATPVAPPANARVVLRGTPRIDRAVAYDEVISSKYGHDVSHGHTIVPMTEADWTPDRPVRFLTDLRGATALPGLPPLPWANYQETSPGVLLTDAVPVYLVRAFATLGVALAPDARLHTTDAARVRETWYGIAAIAAVFAAATLTGGLLMR